MIEPLLPPPFTSTNSSSSSSSSSKGTTNSLPRQQQSPEMARTTERKKSISMKKRGLHLNTGNTSNHHNSHHTSGSQTKSSSSPKHSTPSNPGSSGGGGVSSSRGTGKSNLPPRPPPPPPQLQQPVWIDPLERSNGEQQQPPSHLQCGSSEDLSFADFSAMEDSMDDCYTNSNNSVNDSYHYSYSNDYQRHHNSTFLDGSTPGKSAESRVNAIDVASVGNASDTMVVQESRHEAASLENHHPHHNNSNNNSPQMMVVATRDLHEKAKMAFNAEKYHEALPLFESILSAQIRRFSSTIHPSVGAAMHNVGVCRQRLGEHEMAESLFQEAVEIREQCFGPDHIEVAASLSKLGAAQTSLGKFDEAYEKLRKAVKIATSTLGHNHKTVAQMLCHLACLYFEAGELMSSEATFEDALEIYRGVWSTSVDRAACMTQLMDTLCNVGSIQNRRKRFQEACASFTEALNLQRGDVPPDDARIISTLDNLGYSYSKLRDYNGALQCYRKMYRAQISSSNSNNKECDTGYPPAAFESFRKQILMYEKLRRYQEAIDETTQALRHQQSVLPSDHEIIIHTEELLVDLQQKLRRTSES